MYFCFFTVSISSNVKAKTTYLSILLATLFCLYHLPWPALGQKGFFNAFDNLDSYVVWYRMVMQTGNPAMAENAIVPQIMGGLPKFTLVNSYSFYYLLNRLLTTFQALNVLMVTTSLVGLAGMWLLLRKYWRLDRSATAFLALSFAFTPFLPAWMMSIAGQPLLLYTLLNLREKEAKWWNWLIVAAFPFVSNFQSAGVFILATLGLLIAWDLSKKRSVKKLILAFFALLALYSFAKISLMANLLGGEGFVSHRTEMSRYAVSPLTCVKVFARYFVFGNIDVALSLHTVVLLPLVLVVYVSSAVRNNKPDHQLTLLLLTIAGISLYAAALGWEPVVGLRNRSQLLRMYSLDRAHIFFQLLWHLAAARSVLLLRTDLRRKVLVPVFVAQMLVCFAYQPTYYQYFVRPWLTIRPYYLIYRFEDYYAEEMFSKIKTRIGEPGNGNRVACLGIPPAVAQYNGLWTIDGYVSNYPLVYKHRFRNVIAHEIEKSVPISGFFDGWGSQCIMLYDQQIGYFNTHVTRGLAPATRDLKFDEKALKSLGCRYVLSAENLQFPEKSGLAAIEKFSSALWELTLYEVL